MNIGDIYELEITGISHQGYGVGRIDNIVTFVPQAMLGETVKVKIVEYKKKMATAELLEVIVSNPYRQEANCPHSQNCGGCELQHGEYAYQLQAKRQIVTDAINRLARVEQEVEPVLGMDNPWEYRNKGIFHLDYSRGVVRAGFYEQGSHDFVAIEHCRLFSQQVNEILQTIVELIQQSGKANYIQKVMLRESNANGEVMVVFVIGENSWRLPDLPQKLMAQHQQIVSVYYNINTNPKLMLGKTCILLAGEATITDKLGDLSFRISPQSFFQVNTKQAEVLYQQVLDYATLDGSETVIDAYCGIGTISLFLAQQAKRVIGVESVGQAIKDAKENARFNKMDNCEFVTAKVEDWLPKWVAKNEKADCIVLDPPRKGCDTAVLDSIIRSGMPKIVYVSCNPSTLARDIQYLHQNGYSLEKVQPVDLFCNSWHVECVVLLSKVQN